MRSERNSFSRRFIGNRRGATAMVVGVSLPVLVGFLGLGIEVGLWYLEKRELQEAADSAAMAGAREFVANSAGQAQMEAAAAVAATKSGFASATQVLNQPPASGSYAIGGPLEDPSAVEVVLSAPYSTYFVSLFGLDSVDIRARAVAVEGTDEAQTEACILALAEDDPAICSSEGIQFQGSLNLQTNECSVHSNDSCGPSYRFNGNPTVNVDCMTYSGGLEQSVNPITGSSNNLSLTRCAAPWYFEPVPDPYEDAEIPLNPGPCHSNPNGTTVAPNTKQFTPGHYCGGMPLMGGNNKTNLLEPGIYLIDGDISINGGTITGEDVILVLVDGTFDFRGNGDLSLIAPTSDDIYDPANAAGFEPILVPDQGDGTDHPWDGLALYLNMSGALGEVNSCDNKINGNSTLLVSGTVYGPDTCFVFTGNNTTGAADDPCFRIVAGNIALSGDVTMSSNGCNMPGGPGNTAYGTMIGLVE